MVHRLFSQRRNKHLHGYVPTLYLIAHIRARLVKSQGSKKKNPGKSAGLSHGNLGEQHNPSAGARESVETCRLCGWGSSVGQRDDGK